MALYISAGTRRRRIVVAAAASLAIGLVIGLGLGRVTAPTPVDNATDAKTLAKQATGQLRALPDHYEQVTLGKLDRDTFYASLDAALKRSDDDLATAMQRAVWLDEPTKQGLRTVLGDVRARADTSAPAAEFAAAVQTAITRIDTAFGAPPPTG